MPAETAAAAAAAALEGPGVQAALEVLVAARGLTLVECRHLRTHHRPGGALSALYRVTCHQPGTGPLRLHFGAATAVPGAAAGTPSETLHPMMVEGVELFFWLHPQDPGLPDLPWACDGSAVGSTVFGSAQPAKLAITAYRPLRRAVVHAVSDDTARDGRREEAYLKVLPPPMIRALRRRHQLLEASAVPAPVLRRTSRALPPGALALERAAGEPLLHSLLENGAPWLRPADVLALLEALPPEAAALPLHRPWATRAPAYGRAAALVLPDRAADIQSLAKAIDSAVGAADPGPLVPTHGDFYEGNLLVAGSRITGVLDVDALGPGHRVDDLACFVGHLAVLSAINPAAAGLRAAFTAHRCAYSEAVGAAALNARAAAVALSLVAGARNRPTAPLASRRENALARLAAARMLYDDAVRG